MLTMLRNVDGLSDRAIDVWAENYIRESCDFDEVATQKSRQQSQAYSARSWAGWLDGGHDFQI